MGRTSALKPRVSTVGNRLKGSTTKDARLTGRGLQKIRFSMWRQDPKCRECGKLTQHPYGYQIDHIVPLDEGGRDSEENRQLLCNKCHDAKTKAEAKVRGY